MKRVVQFLFIIAVFSKSFLGFGQAGSNTCGGAQATPISIPFTHIDSICGAAITNNYNMVGASCTDPATTQGPDFLYYFCAPSTGIVNVTLTDFFFECYDPTKPFAYQSLTVWSACPSTGTCLAAAPVSVINPDKATSLSVTAGQCYYIMVDNYPAYCPCFRYKIIVDYVVPDVVQPACTNIGFESGTFTGWSATYGRTMAPGVATAPTPIYTPAFYTTSPYQHAITSGGALDPYGLFPIVYPGGGGFSARLGNLDTAGYGGATLEQTFSVTSTNSLFTYYYAVVVQDAGHNDYEQPFFKAEVFDCNGVPLSCGQYLVVGGPNIPNFKLSTKGVSVYYRPWTAVAFNLSPYIGSCVKIKFTVGDCSQGAHFAYAYVDAKCGSFQVDLLPQTCPTDPVSLKGPDGFDNYTWTGPGIVGSGASQSIQVNQSGAYHLDMTLLGNISCGDHLDTTLNITFLPPFVTTPASTPAACGISNGTAAVSATSGGNGGYTYSWNNGGGAAALTGLAPGTYTVTIKDSKGCAFSSTATVGVNPGPTAAMNPPTNLTCASGSNGSASVNAAGGTTNYTYSWSNGSNTVSSSTTNVVTGLLATNYTVTVYDAGSCSATATVTLTAPPPVTASPTATPTSCGKSDGTATTTSGGGSAPYSYNWSTAATSQTITGLASGDYTVTVSDAGGCTGTNTTTVAPSAAVNPGATSTPATCGVANGSADATATGGVSPYTYMWSTSATTKSITGLAANGYTVTIMDAAGCTGTSVATVNNSGGATLVMGAPTNILCNGGANGSVSVNASGGVTNYTYSWSTGASSVTSFITDGITGLKAGGYTVTVTDGKGCQITTSALLTEPPPIVPVPGSLPASCAQSNGTATISASGGNGTLSYTWSMGSNAQTVNGLAANSYTVTVTDANACVITTVANVNNSNGPAVLMGAPTNLKCFGDKNGMASASATGGTGALSYSWSSGPTSQTVGGLIAGTYTVTVNDGSGCQIMSTVSITQPTKVAVIVSGLPAKCKGSCDGQGVVIPSGGTSPYTAAWSTAGTGLSVNGLCVGTYSITISDANSCTKDSLIIVTEPPAIASNAASVAADCNKNNGSASVAGSGGTPGYVYAWTGGATGVTAYNLTAGTYTVTVTDKNNCSTTSTTVVLNNNGVNASIQSSTPVTCFGGCNATAIAQPTGGTMPYTYVWTGAATAQTVNNLCKGIYTVTITDNKNCTSTAVATITEPTILSVPALGPASACIGQTTVLTANPSGGTAPYTINWNPGAQTGASINVKPNQNTTYTVMVTDANGCATPAQTVTVNVSPPLKVAVNSVTPACPGASVTIAGVATGGNGQYSYTWLTTPQQNTASITEIIKGKQSYTLVVSDGCGTPNDTAKITVDVNPVPTVNFSSLNKEGCPKLCINFTDNSTIPLGTITNWIWDFGDSISTVQNGSVCYDKPGKHTVKLTAISDKGCASTDSIVDMITVYDKPVAAFSVDPNKATILSPSFQFSDMSKGATDWLWDFGDPGDSKTSVVKNPNHSYPDIGSYCILLTVKNPEGCVDTVTHCVEVLAEFSFYVPDAFSPNGDGINETFSGKGIGIKKYKMIVFDRWGNLIYTTEDLNVGWNGRANGGKDLAQQDVYVYKIVLSDIFDRTHQYLGHISLVR